MKNPNVINIEATNDIKVAKLRAYYGKMATGYKEAEADEMREKILNTPNTEKLYEIKGSIYYVSTDGNDSNDGLTPESAIKTLDAIENLPLKDGDSVLFKRGDIFRFCRTINVVDGITYGSYGEGMKPAIYGSPENYALSNKWTKFDGNIWQIPFDYNYASGCVLDYGMTVGVQKIKGFDTFQENGDYYHDLENKIFYLYCDKGNPSECYHSIEIMPTTHIFFMRGNRDVVIDNLCIKYSAAFGVTANDVKGNIKITNCEFGYLGGLWTNLNEKTLRFGNAVEFWAGIADTVIENVLVKNNWFYQTYDSALTWQGSKEGTIYKDITYTENLFEYNNCDIEFFDKNNSVVDNFVMSKNIMRFTSMGWGTRMNDGAPRGIEGCIRAVTGSAARLMIVKSSYFTDNLIDCPARQIINWGITPDQRKNLHASGSKVWVKTEYRTFPEGTMQGLQMEGEESNIKHKATNKEELEAIWPRFEEGAEIHWDE